MKRYLREPESDDARARLASDAVWVSARVTLVEVLRVLSVAVPRTARAQQVDAFRADWRRVNVVELDATTCDRAADFAATLDLRSMDALHLAAAHRVGGPALPFLTYDLRQARAARAMGWTVVGA